MPQAERRYQRVCKDVAIELKEAKIPLETLIPAAPKADGGEATEAKDASSEQSALEPTAQALLENIKAFKVRQAWVCNCGVLTVA